MAAFIPSVRCSSALASGSRSGARLAVSIRSLSTSDDTRPHWWHRHQHGAVGCWLCGGRLNDHGGWSSVAGRRCGRLNGAWRRGVTGWSAVVWQDSVMPSADDLVIVGAGVGVRSQLEDDVLVYPVIVVLDWQITDRLSLDTHMTTGWANQTVVRNWSTSWRRNLDLAARGGLRLRTLPTRFNSGPTFPAAWAPRRRCRWHVTLITWEPLHAPGLGDRPTRWLHRRTVEFQGDRAGVEIDVYASTLRPGSRHSEFQGAVRF